MRFKLALSYAKLINKGISIIDKNRGSNLAGEKALVLDPQMVAHFKNIDFDRVLFITGTNGKSTLTNLVVHLLRSQGKKVISNLEGANLLPGIATSLAKESNSDGKVTADYFVFEVDERYLPLIYEQMPAKHLAIINLFKDQVQRNGDPDFIVRKLNSVINDGMTLYLNNDEPRTKSFENRSNQVIYFGVEKTAEAYVRDKNFPTLSCPNCRGKIIFDYYNSEGVGCFRCDDCQFASNQDPGYLVKDIDYENETFIMNGVTFKMPYNMPFMLYNYAAAVAIISHFANITAAEIAPAFETFKNVGGRFEVLHYHDKTIKYLRIKQENPETLQNALNIIASDPKRKMVCFGFYPLKDFVPFYTNSFYTWDCDFRPLIRSDVEQFYCFSEVVCYDVANRLIYDGVDANIISVADSNDVKEIFAAIDQAETDDIWLITWISDFMKMKKYILEEGKRNEK